MAGIIAVPQGAGKDTAPWGCPSPHRTQVTGIINKTRGTSFPKANSQRLNWPEVFSSPTLTETTMFLEGTPQ